MSSHHHHQDNGHRTPTPADGAGLAALAREIEALRQRLEPLDGLDQRLTELADTVADLANEVAARGCRHASGVALSWLGLPDGTDGGEPIDPGSIQPLLERLAGWVARVYLRYADAAKTLPECWLWHPDVIEELTWLHHAWCCAYQDAEAAPGWAWDWHDRYRPGVVARVDRLAGRCSLDQHAHPSTGAQPTVLGLGELGELAAWWANQRHTAAPAPSTAALQAARAAEAARLTNGARR